MWVYWSFAIAVFWLHLKVQIKCSIYTHKKNREQVMRASLSMEGDCTICFPIWCDEWSVIRKLFHIRSALLISVCQSENIAPSGSLCSREELLLFLQFMDISFFPLSSKCITSCPERGNMLWSCRSYYEANEVSVPVWTINVTSCSYTVPLSAMEHLCGNDLLLFQFRKYKTIKSGSEIIENDKVTSSVINEMVNSSYVLC